MDYQVEAPALRRNKRIPSCEPCRIGKLRCDHEHPICRRCKHRRKESSCVYHPAPMSKKTTMTQLASTRSSTSPQTHSPSITASQSENAIARVPDGFLGSTSFFASLAETEQDMDPDLPGVNFAFEAEQLSLFYDENAIEQGIRVLKCLYPISCMDDLFSDWRCPISSRVPTVILKECSESVKTLLCPDEVTEKSDAQLREISKFLFQNTSRKLPLPGTLSMKQYTGHFTGQNMRWETVGTILSAVSLEKSYKVYGREGQDVLRHFPSWKDFIDNTSRCLDFCDDLGAINDVVLWILSENLVSLMLRYGEGSYIPWKRLGDLSSSLFALGLYNDHRITMEVPRWLAELRKHNLLYAYILDKFLAMFVGRPPRIIGRYCALELPMIIDEATLSLPPAQLEQEILRVGEGVWNHGSLGEFPTFASTNLPVYMLREDIMELFLGNSPGNVNQNISNLAHRSKQIWESREERFRYHFSIWEDPENVDEAWDIMELHFDQLYNDWLLQRIMVQRLNADPAELFRRSENLLSEALPVVMRVAVEGWNLCDLPWLILMFCLPPAGVLTLELLRQSQSRKFQDIGFSRSKVIQHLSVLISTLGAIGRPGIGNDTLCKQAQGMLQRSLDRILHAAVNEPPLEQGDKIFEGIEKESSTLGDWPWSDLIDPCVEFWSNLEESSLLMINLMDTSWPGTSV